MNEVIEKGVKIAKNVVIGHNVVIKSGAKIGGGSVIGDFSYIGSDVVIGKNNEIGIGVVIKGNTKIGNNNHIGDKTVIGECSKHIGYHRYGGRVIIGDNNFISNGCAIDLGNNHLSHKGYDEYKRYLSIDLSDNDDFEDATIIGDRCYILNDVTIHHNCRVGLGDLNSTKSEYDTVICTGCCLNGFVSVRKGVELGSGTFVREYVSIGEGAMTAMQSYIVKDVMPFSKIVKNRYVGRSDNMIEKFEITESKLMDVCDKFKNKRSSRLNLYEESYD